MKDKIQVFAGAMMTPIIVMVVAGFFIGIGSAFYNINNVQALGLGGIIVEGNLIHSFFKLINDLGFMVMRFLPLFFTVAITFSLAKREKGWAAFGAVVFFIAMNQVISSLFAVNGITPETTTVEAFVSSGMSLDNASMKAALYTTFLGIFTYDSSIFGAYITAFLASVIHNRFYQQKLRPSLSFFSGPRFAIIMMFIFAIPVGIIMYFGWPILSSVISSGTNMLTGSGLFGTFAIGFLDKALLPFGLHHLIPVQYTSMGGTMEIGGQLYQGVTNIMYAQLGDPDSMGYITRNFETGRILVHFGALPGITYAMYKTAFKENRKKAASILIPAVVTAFAIGITEPIEYTFLFVAPALFFLVYAPLTALGYVLCEALNVSIIGASFRNLFPNLLQPQKVHAWPLVFLIPIFFIVFYFIFKWAIEKWDIKTPGRDGREDFALYSKKDYKEKQEAEKIGSDEFVKIEISDDLPQRILEALGGKENIENITNCATRLRVELKEVEKCATDEEWTSNLSAIGIVRRKKSLQIIYGTQVIQITTKIKEIIDWE
ncbi:PTS transporter subunit EIIC [Amedibacillus sp. YH-ame10]